MCDYEYQCLITVKQSITSIIFYKKGTFSLKHFHFLPSDKCRSRQRWIKTTISYIKKLDYYPTHQVPIHSEYHDYLIQVTVCTFTYFLHNTVTY